MYSIIIPTRGSYHTLMQCLERVADTVAPGSAEILVVLNGNDFERNVCRGVAEAVRSAVGAGFPMRILTSSRPGFTHAVNLGAEKARGEDLVLLNDDTLPGPGWLDRMVEHRAMMQATYPMVRFGAVGPVSNYVLGTQSIAQLLPACTDPANLAAVAAAVAETPPFQRKRICAVLSGFCLLVPTKLWRMLGGLRVIGPLGGCEDLDFGLRLRDVGYLNLVADTAFVYHHGSVTLNAKDPEGKGGTAYAPLLYTKWREDALTQPPPSLGIFYRVRVSTEFDYEIFLRSLTEARKYAKAIAVYNDQSTVYGNWPSLRDAVEYTLGPEILLLWEDKDPTVPFNEAADRSAALQLARGAGTTWLFNLDHDEVIDEHTDPQLFQDLMAPLDPNTTAYSFPVRTCWRGQDAVRIDGIWGGMRLPTLFRADASFGPIFPEGDSPFHCARFPTLMPSDGLVLSNRTTIWHYGYVDYEQQAKRKYAYYQERDTVKDIRLIGAADYRHLVDELGLILTPRRRYRVALALMAKNNAVQALDVAVRYRAFFDTVVVQDNGSTDALSTWCQQLGISCIPWHCCDQAMDPAHLTCDFAAARNHLVETLRSMGQDDYVLMLDPDEMIHVQSLIQFDQLFAKPADAYMGRIWNYARRARGLEKQPQLACRLFSLRRPEIHYTRALHETVEETLLTHRETLTVTDVSPIFQIDHTGFLVSPAERQRKETAYANRLEQLLPAHPEDPVLLYSLGLHYNQTGQRNLGIPLVARALQCYPQFWKARQELVEQYMRSALLLLSDIPDGGAPVVGTPEAQYAAQMARAMLQFFPDLHAAATIDA